MAGNHKSSDSISESQELSYIMACVASCPAMHSPILKRDDLIPWRDLSVLVERNPSRYDGRVPSELSTGAGLVDQFV